MNNSMQLFDSQDEKISQRIIKARESLGLNKTEFAKKANMQPSQVSEIERGVRNITPEMLLKMEMAFNINWRYIARGEGEMFLLTDRSYLNEPIVKYGEDLQKLKEEVELWRNKFLTVNEKYTRLLESTSNLNVNSGHNKSAG